MGSIKTIGLLGFGEVGQVLAADLLSHHGEALAIRVFDTQFVDPHSAVSQAVDLQFGVKQVSIAEQLGIDCQLVISVVTAGEALAAAENVLPGLAADAFFLDLNSVSPDTKIAIAEKVQHSGGQFVEGAIMSPINPKRIASPILLGGDCANTFLGIGRELGFTGMQFSAENLGRAAATKMCRSVVVKGLEALVTESLLAARHYGVEDEVLASLNSLLPLPDWSEHARYLISRSIKHGSRRAEEMREVARTVTEAGLIPHMSRGCVERQQWAAQFSDASDQPDLHHLLDAIIHQHQLPECAQ